MLPLTDKTKALLGDLPAKLTLEQYRQAADIILTNQESGLSTTVALSLLKLRVEKPPPSPPI
jgi:hypothetical protein